MILLQHSLKRANYSSEKALSLVDGQVEELLLIRLPLDRFGLLLLQFLNLSVLLVGNLIQLRFGLDAQGGEHFVAEEFELSSRFRL